MRRCAVERRQRFGERDGVAAGRHREIVAGVFALLADAPAEPPRRGMEEQQRFRRRIARRSTASPCGRCARVRGRAGLRADRPARAAAIRRGRKRPGAASARRTASQRRSTPGPPRRARCPACGARRRRAAASAAAALHAARAPSPTTRASRATWRSSIAATPSNQGKHDPCGERRGCPNQRACLGQRRRADRRPGRRVEHRRIAQDPARIAAQARRASQ